MEYNFGTETQSGSNNETNLSVSNSCETMCAALSFRVGLPLSPLIGAKMVKFCIGTRVRKNTTSRYKVPPRHMLNSPTAAAYCALFYFRADVKEGLDVTQRHGNYVPCSCTHDNQYLVIQHPSQTYPARGGLPLIPHST